MPVRAFAAKATDKGLGEIVLHRFGWCDVVPFDLVVLLPLAQSHSNQVDPIVADPHARDSRASSAIPVEFAGDTDTGQQRVGD